MPNGLSQFFRHITPDEVRKLFGLPDVEAFQRQMMDDIRERMMAGAEAIEFMQAYNVNRAILSITGITAEFWLCRVKLFARSRISIMASASN